MDCPTNTRRRTPVNTTPRYATAYCTTARRVVAVSSFRHTATTANAGASRTLFCKTLRPLHRSSARPSLTRPSFSSDVLATTFGRACKRGQCAHTWVRECAWWKICGQNCNRRRYDTQLRCAFSVAGTSGTAQMQHSALDRCCTAHVRTYTDNTPHIRRKYRSLTFLHQPYGPHLKSWSSPPPNCSRQPFPPLPSSSTVGGDKTGRGGGKRR